MALPDCAGGVVEGVGVWNRTRRSDGCGCCGVSGGERLGLGCKVWSEGGIFGDGCLVEGVDLAWVARGVGRPESECCVLGLASGRGLQSRIWDRRDRGAVCAGRRSIAEVGIRAVVLARVVELVHRRLACRGNADAVTGRCGGDGRFLGFGRARGQSIDVMRRKFRLSSRRTSKDHGLLLFVYSRLGPDQLDPAARLGVAVRLELIIVGGCKQTKHVLTAAFRVF